MRGRVSVKLRDFSGARALRLSDNAGTAIPEHAHDWPVLSLFVLGSYRNQSVLGETVVSRPSAMFYRACEPHSTVTGTLGLEQIDLELDPSWLGLSNQDWSPVVNWDGGSAGLRARELAKLWSDPASCETNLRRSTREFLIQCFQSPRTRQPSWLKEALRMIDDTPVVTASEIAGKLNMHPGWFAEAYRSAMGEGVGETIRRRRVEQARHMLMSSTEPQAQVAAAVGFCDQSHMIRAFQAVLGRTPNAVRREQFDDRSALSPS